MKSILHEADFMYSLSLMLVYHMAKAFGVSAENFAGKDGEDHAGITGSGNGKKSA